MIAVQKVDVEAVSIIRQLAIDTWKVVYKEIISQQQIDYMLELNYSTSSLQDQIALLQHQFILIKEHELSLGFASYAVKSIDAPTVFRLHKLYVLPNQHGKGLGKKLLDFIISDVKSKGAVILELNVNRNNKAIDFYKKNGFTIAEEKVLDIGNGFVMDDYIMELAL